MPRHFFALPTTLIIALGGCAPEPLSNEADGLFPCEAPGDCPSDQTCFEGRCWGEGGPSLQIVSPSDGQALPFEWGLESRPTTVVLRGFDLELQPPDGENRAPGTGHLVVRVDGKEAAIIDDGDLTSGVSVEVAMSPEPGPHRIEVIARRDDESAYRSPEATARRLFWIDDGRTRIAFKHPFPGDVLPSGTHWTEVSVATIHFDMIPDEDGDTGGAQGHAHLHYGDEFPSCAYLPDCDGAPTAELLSDIQSTTATREILLPDTQPGVIDLTAILRRPDHATYMASGAPIYETIELPRQAID